MGRRNLRGRRCDGLSPRAWCKGWYILGWAIQQSVTFASKASAGRPQALHISKRMAPHAFWSTGILRVKGPYIAFSI